jgi:hypothetical protein
MAVHPMAMRAGARAVAWRPSRHAPSGLVALCFFESLHKAAAWARRSPGLFGVSAPVIRRRGPFWAVSVPVSSVPHRSLSW